MSLFGRIKSAVVGNPVTKEYEIGRHLASAGPGLLWKVHSGVKKSTRQVQYNVHVCSVGHQTSVTFYISPGCTCTCTRDLHVHVHVAYSVTFLFLHTFARPCVCIYMYMHVHVQCICTYTCMVKFHYIWQCKCIVINATCTCCICESHYGVPWCVQSAHVQALCVINNSIMSFVLKLTVHLLLGNELSLRSTQVLIKPCSCTFMYNKYRRLWLLSACAY